MKFNKSENMIVNIEEGKTFTGGEGSHLLRLQLRLAPIITILVHSVIYVKEVIQ